MEAIFYWQNQHTHTHKIKNENNKNNHDDKENINAYSTYLLLNSYILLMNIWRYTNIVQCLYKYKHRYIPSKY